MAGPVADPAPSDAPSDPTEPIDSGAGGPLEGGAPAAAPPARPWRRRHPVLARTLLYGTAALLALGGYVAYARTREGARQAALLTRIHGIEVAIRPVSPATALQQLRDEVLAKRPNEDVRRRALLAEAAALDELRRFDEADGAYRRLEEGWPAGRPAGALNVPWANMLVRAGRPSDALSRLDAPGATAGESDEDVQSVRDAATRSPVRTSR